MVNQISQESTTRLRR